MRAVFSSLLPNVSVHPRRTLCAVVVERLVRSHFHRLFPFMSQIVFVSPSRHPATVVQHRSFSFRTSAFRVGAALCAVTLERLVRIFILAVHSSHPKLLSARRHTFVLPCPAAFIIRSERQRSPSAHLVRRRGGTPCWIPFSLAVPGFALRNRSRGVRDLCFSVVEGPSCARWLIIF